MSHVIYVPYVSVEISEEDHWEEVGKHYFTSYNDAYATALAVIQEFQDFHTYKNAKYSPGVYTLPPAHLTSDDPI